MIKSISIKGYKSFGLNSIKCRKQKLLKAGILSYTHRKKKKFKNIYIYGHPSKFLAMAQNRIMNTVLPLKTFNIYSKNIYKKELMTKGFNKEILVFSII